MAGRFAHRPARVFLRVLVALLHLLAARVDVLVVLRLGVGLGRRVRHVEQEGMKLGLQAPAFISFRASAASAPAPAPNRTERASERASTAQHSAARQAPLAAKLFALALRVAILRGTAGGAWCAPQPAVGRRERAACEGGASPFREGPRLCLTSSSSTSQRRPRVAHQPRGGGQCDGGLDGQDPLFPPGSLRNGATPS